MDPQPQHDQPQVQIQTPTSNPATPVAATEVKKVPMMKKKIPANTVNLMIVFIISFLLLIHALFAPLTSQLEQLRFFVPYVNNPDLLDKLLPLRVGLGFVFFWYAIDNFEHPEIFNNLSNLILKKFKLETHALKLYPLAFIQSAFEFLVGVSFVTGIFMDIGSLIASLLLFAVLFAYEEGLGSLLIRDIGLLGASITVFLLTIW